MNNRQLPRVDEGTTKRLVRLFSSMGWANFVADGRTLLGHSLEETIAYLTENPEKIACLYRLHEAAKVYGEKMDALGAFLEAIECRADEALKAVAVVFPNMGSKADSFPRIDCGGVGHA